MVPTYRIAKWDTVFTSYATRQLRQMVWVKLPTTLGRGVRMIGRLTNGHAIFGAFLLMVEVASNMPKRGVLADNRGPLDATDLELLTGFPAAGFTEAFKMLTGKIGWLEVEGQETESGLWDGPGRADDINPRMVGVAPEVWDGYFVDLDEAFGLDEAESVKQRASFAAVIGTIMRATSEAAARANALESMVELAVEKQKHCKRPIAAWQAEMNTRWGGAKNEGQQQTGHA